MMNQGFSYLITLKADGEIVVAIKEGGTIYNSDDELIRGPMLDY
jgi:hypothetical protein